MGPVHVLTVPLPIKLLTMCLGRQTGWPKYLVPDHWRGRTGKSSLSACVCVSFSLYKFALQRKKEILSRSKALSMSCVPLFGIMSLYVSWDIYIPHWRVWAQSQLCFWFWLPADVHIKRQQVLTQEPVPSAQTEGLMLIFKLLASTWMNSGSCGQFGIWIRTWNMICVCVSAFQSK